MTIKKVALHEIKPYENNPRHHPVKQLEAIVKSIERFGFRGSILLDRHNVIVAGHARYEAASVAGLSEIPCEYADDLSDEEIAAYRVLDNKIAEMSSDDNVKLYDELAKLPDFDFTEFGIEFPEIEQLPNEGLCDEDDTPELKIEATVKRGDVWLLGKHRLMCGDSTMIDDVEKLMAGEKALLMLTDPPYGVNLDQSWRDEALGDKALGKGNKQIIQNDDRADWTDTYALFNGSIAYVWHASCQTDLVKKNLEDCQLLTRQMIIWNKSIMVMGRSAYHWKHEPCWYAVRKGSDANWKGDRKQTTVWDAASPNHIMSGSKEDKTEHPSQKPIILFEIPIINHTVPNDGIYDPFGGSGSTLIACEKTNRKCYMMELSPQYVSVIIERWQKFTGLDAVLESTGETFNSISPLVGE